MPLRRSPPFQRAKSAHQFGSLPRGASEDALGNIQKTTPKIA